MNGFRPVPLRSWMIEGDGATVDRDAVTLTHDWEHRVRLPVLLPS